MTAVLETFSREHRISFEETLISLLTQVPVGELYIAKDMPNHPTPCQARLRQFHYSFSRTANRLLQQRTSFLKAGGFEEELVP